MVLAMLVGVSLSSFALDRRDARPSTDELCRRYEALSLVNSATRRRRKFER
jgi:hypothetical protein